MNMVRVRLQGMGHSGAAGLSVELGLELLAGRISRARVLLGDGCEMACRVGAAELALEGQYAHVGLFQLAADRILEDAHSQAGRGRRIEVGRKALVDAMSEVAFGPRG